MSINDGEFVSIDDEARLIDECCDNFIMNNTLDEESAIRIRTFSEYLKLQMGRDYWKK